MPFASVSRIAQSRLTVAGSPCHEPCVDPFKARGFKERLQSVGGRLSVYFATLNLRSVLAPSLLRQSRGETAILARLAERPGFRATHG